VPTVPVLGESGPVVRRAAPVKLFSSRQFDRLTTDSSGPASPAAHPARYTHEKAGVDRQRMYALASKMPGFVSFKRYSSEDGMRLPSSGSSPRRHWRRGGTIPSTLRG
jgi:hypothetical protein